MVKSDKIRLTLLTLLLSLCCFICDRLNAETHDYYLHITDATDNSMEFVVNNQLLLDFNDGNLIVYNPEKRLELHFDSISKIEYLSNRTNGIYPMTSSANLQIGSNFIAFSSPDNRILRYYVVNAMGQTFIVGSFYNEFNLNIESMPTGVYILCIESLSPIKFIVE